MYSKHSLSLWFAQRPRRNFLILSALLVLALYWHAFSAPFVYDDLDQIVNNPNLQPWSSFVHRFFFRPVSLNTSYLGYGGSTYRPLFWLSLFLDRAFWGLSAPAFHATNILLHFLNGNLVFALFRRLKLPVSMAAAVALLWLSLPINTEVVAWVSGRSYVLCTFFILLCLLSAITHLERPQPRWAIACSLTAACAVLSHELGIVILPLLLVLVFVTRLKWSKGLFLTIGAVTAAVAAVEALRIGVGVKSFSAFASIKWIGLALWEYVSLTVLPVHMSVERSTTLSLSQPHLWSYVGLLGFGLALGYALFRRRDHPVLLDGLGWFAIGVAPFCILLNYQGLAERFAYFAAIGMVAAIVAVCMDVRQPQVRRTLAVCLALWSLWNLCRTSIRVADWSDEVRLYRSSLAATPQSPSVHFNLAYSLRERGQLQEAIAEYQRTVEIDKTFPKGYAGLGDAYLRMNAYAQAQAAYQKALAQDPNDAAVLLNVGAAYQGAGALPEADATWQRVLQIDPKSSAAHVNLGVLYVAENRQSDAMHQFAIAIDMKSNDIVPYYDLGALFQQAGRGDLAMPLYTKVLELKPGDEDTLRNIRLLQQGH
jgi:tetratricopeptide (TPR) repeat protein